jgi:site-specific DNA-methyltransferase (adenine-specific)
MEFLNQIIHGNCIEKMKDIPDGFIDMILADPPYGITSCKWDTVIPFEPMWAQLKRVIKKNRAIVLFGNEPFSSALRMSNIKNYKYDWVWDKTIPFGMGFCKYRPMQQTENILVFNAMKTYYPIMINRNKPIKETTGTTKTNVNKFPKMDFLGGKVYTEKYPINLIRFSKVPNSKGTLHPTQKPAALMEYLIKTYTNEGELVLDFCAGSFTTAIAAINTKRNYICIEKEQEYCAIGLNRINETLKGKDLFSL